MLLFALQPTNRCHCGSVQGYEVSGTHMTWTVEFHSDSKLVELTFSGRVTGQELMEAAAERIELGREKGATMYLIDAAEMVAPRSTTLNVYEIPEKIYVEKDMDRTSRIAVVVPSDSESHWVADFYEDVSVNRGWCVHKFTDRTSAIDWLQE